MREGERVLKFFVYLTYFSDCKTLIIADEQNVFSVIDASEMSNTEMIRLYSRLIAERASAGNIITNHKAVKYRKIHTSDFNFNYIYKTFSTSMKAQFIELAYKFTDEQDRKLRELNR